MTHSASLVDAEEWLKVIDQDYLHAFIREGGSCVRVGVGNDATREFLCSSLIELATKRGYVTARVASDKCKIHLVHELVHAINRQIPWREIAERVVRLALSNYDLGSIGTVSIEEVARQRDVAPMLVRRRLERYLTAEVYRDKSLSRDFRLAMMQMTNALADADPASQLVIDALELWLKGELPRIGALKRFYIHEQINRHNARGVFGSLGPWLTKAGYAGLVTVIDISRYAESIPLSAGLVRYTPARALDTYEVLREFIDTTEDLRSTLILFLTGAEFGQDDRRGMRAYNALYMRLAEDVRGRHVANPLAPMVRFDDERTVA